MVDALYLVTLALTDQVCQGSKVRIVTSAPHGELAHAVLGTSFANLTKEVFSHCCKEPGQAAIYLYTIPLPKYRVHMIVDYYLFRLTNAL